MRVGSAIKRSQSFYFHSFPSGRRKYMHIYGSLLTSGDTFEYYYYCRGVRRRSWWMLIPTSYDWNYQQNQRFKGFLLSSVTNTHDHSLEIWWELQHLVLPATVLYLCPTHIQGAYAARAHAPQCDEPCRLVLESVNGLVHSWLWNTMFVLIAGERILQLL